MKKRDKISILLLFAIFICILLTLNILAQEVGEEGYTPTRGDPILTAERPDITSPTASTPASTSSSTTSADTEVQQKVQEFFNKLPVKYILGIVFGLWDTNQLNDIYPISQQFGIVNRAGAIITYIMIWLILFVAFMNIVSIFSPFSKWVGVIIGLGLAIATSQMKGVYWIAIKFAWLISGFGAFSVFIGIGLAFVAFLVSSFFGIYLKEIFIKKKLAEERIKTITAAQKAAIGAKALQEVQEELAKGAPY